MRNKSHLTLAKEVIEEKNQAIIDAHNRIERFREVLEKISKMRPFHDTCSLENCPVCVARKALEPK